METKTVGLYVRVSTLDQEKGLQSQEQALRDYASNQGLQCTKWYRDRVSGATTNRPAFAELQADIHAGKIGMIVCWKLNRLSRSLQDGVNVLADWCKRGIRVVSVTEQLDFSGTVGQLIASVLLAVGQMERESICKNIRRGQQAARAKGITWGGSRRGRLLSITPEQARMVIKLHNQGEKTGRIAKTVNIDRSSAYRIVKNFKSGCLKL